MAYRSRYAAPEPVRSRTSRWRIFLPSAILLLLFAGLAVFWVWASWRVGQEMDSWLDREARLGRTWTCPDRSIGGFPFRIELRCNTPSFEGQRGERAVRGLLGQVTAVAQLQSPGHVFVEAEGPLTVADSAGGSLRVEWELARASLQGQPGSRLDQLALEVTKPRLAMSGFGLPETQALADMVDMHVRRTPDRPEAERAYDVAASAGRLSWPLFDRLAGDAEPADAEVVATILQAEPPTGAQDPARELERWRLAGGRLQVSRLMLSKGAKRLDGTGTLGLDDQHRPQGRVDLSVAGLDALLQQFGLSPKAANLGGLIAGVLGGKPPKAQVGAPPGLVLQLRLDDGKVFLGPLPVARLTPLY